MLKFKDVYKSHNGTILEDVNFKIMNNTIAIGSGSALLLKLTTLYLPDSGEITNDSYFYIFSSPSKRFNKVKDLISNYRTYYDITAINIYLESYNFDLNEKLSSLSFDRLKLLYLIIAIRSNVEVIIAELLFDNIELSTKTIMIELIKESNTKFFFTSNDLDVEEVIESILYIDKELEMYNLKEFINNFVKLNLTLNNDEEISNVIYKEKNEDVTTIIIRKEHKEKILKETCPSTITECKISMKDIPNIL